MARASKTKKEVKAKNQSVDNTAVMSAVASVVDFMKQQVKVNLSEASNQGKIEVSNEELRKICFYVEASMAKSFTAASSQIESTLK